MERILVVDDEKGIIFALRHYFVRQGYEVDSAGTSEEALAHLAENRYAVAIIDIELRGSTSSWDGLNLAEFIRRHAPSTVVIILSAVESPETQRRAREAGVHSFLSKPAPLARVADTALTLLRAAATVALLH
ncbi:MAG TPA: response regulator [Thermoanaerobaculia bacterium]|nr:response regulator [Thermoanaerobaculia bacterium]